MASPNLIVHHLQTGQGERIPWLLEELNLPYTLKNYPRGPLFAPPQYRVLHPIGASPVLEDHTDSSNPIILAESGAIVEYIIQKYGNGRLALGPTHKDFADYLYWFHFANGSLQPGLFRRGQIRGMVGEADPKLKHAEARVEKALRFINNRLLTTGAWLAGEEFTAADVMTAWTFTTMRRLEPIDLTEYEGIQAWLKRVGQREAYRRAMGKSDPRLNIDDGLSVKGPSRDEFYAILTTFKQKKRKL